VWKEEGALPSALTIDVLKSMLEKLKEVVESET
jgi:hypothetical protein